METQIPVELLNVGAPVIPLYMPPRSKVPYVHQCVPMKDKLLQEGNVLEIAHFDYNLFSIQACSKYIGVNVWSKEEDQKVEIEIPTGYFLIIAGKQLEYLTGGEVVAPKHEVLVTEKIRKDVIEAKAMENRNISLWRITSTLFSQLSAGKEMFPLRQYKTLEAKLKYPPKVASEFMNESFPGMFPNLPLTQELKEKND